MELTTGQLETIREHARTVEYGSITIHVSATSNDLNLEIHKRIRIEGNPAGTKKFKVLLNKK